MSVIGRNTAGATTDSFSGTRCFAVYLGQAAASEPLLSATIENDGFAGNSDFLLGIIETTGSASPNGGTVIASATGVASDGVRQFSTLTMSGNVVSGRHYWGLWFGRNNAGSFRWYRSATTGTRYRGDVITWPNAPATFTQDDSYPAEPLAQIYLTTQSGVVLDGNASAEAAASGDLNAVIPLDAAAAGESSASATLHVPNLGILISDIYQPNSASLVADATGVAWAVFDKAPDGTEVRRVGGAAGVITNGDMLIDNQAVGALGGTGFVTLRWTDGANEITYSATETIIDIDA